MALFSSHRSSRPFVVSVPLLAAALLGAGLLAAPAAHAFTMQDGSGNAADQSFLYPGGVPTTDSGQTQGFKQQDGMTTLREGNTTFQFGHRQSFDERYNTDHLFDPLGHPPGER